MSFDRVPSKSVVMEWNPHQLADYMKKLNLSGCDKVIMKCSINGQRFLNMTENDHQKFPKIHAPLISKICSEINRKEEKRRFFTKRTAAPKYEPAMPQEDQPWGPDEFDEGSDEDYENPDAEEDDGSGGDYESPTEDVGLEDSDNGYESPPSEAPEEIPHQLRAAKPMADGEYIGTETSIQHCLAVLNSSHKEYMRGLEWLRDSYWGTVGGSWRVRVHVFWPGGRSANMPLSRALTLDASVFDRRRKPTKLDRTRLAESPIPATKLNTTNMPAPHSWRPQAEERGPDPPRMPKPPLPCQQEQLVGRQSPAEQQQDGAFLVRDSSKRSSIQPYTLMVLYQDKVYNIQIRCEQNEFLLGTGLKVSETYPMVAHIIAHYRQSPLLLIDAKNRGSGQQSQCPLIYPAGGALASLYPSF
ncbi:unnamed protein product [Oncorhynchus mykiss]|uniref:Lymphocyte cytosolic protein 2 n=1 Tax=Oncorhynchus mykiss TaxID=8022 RepID=A0A060XJM0_ONCMY|nr:unnamed protein product [Oncorhynchus mykiss]